MSDVTSGADLPADAASASGKRSAGLARRIVLSVMEKMTNGCLHLVLPDGTAHVFGTPGSGAAAIIRVRNAAFFTKCLLYGDVGFGESYVDGDWDTPCIRDVIAWAILNTKNSPLAGGSKMGGTFNLLQMGNRLAHVLRANTPRISRRNIEAHYDLGNEFYRLWLDPTMTYSSALFTAPEQSLEAAQTAKYDRLCTQLRLRPSDRVLEIGCGWGGFAVHAARRYGCRVTGVTISPSQHRYAVERMAREGLADRVSIELCDYRQLSGTYDKIVSIEMMEALGDRYLPIFCNAIDRLLAPEGLAALQFITVPDATHRDLRRGVDFIQKHIFPGSLLLSVGRVNAALSEAGGFCLHNLEDLGASYARTLGQWWRSFNAQESAVRALGFDSRFMRKWNYYLQYCEAAFATRHISAVQVLYTRPNNLSLQTL